MKKSPKVKFIAKFSDYKLEPKNFNFYNPLYKYIYECLEVLLEKNCRPCFSTTLKVINFWNSNENPKFSFHRTSTMTNVIKFANVLITYQIKIKGHSLKQILNGINAFSNAARTSRHLKYRKKIYLVDTFLWDNPNSFGNKPWFSLCMGPESTLREEAAGITTEYKNTLVASKRAFIEVFCPEQKSAGNKLFELYYSKFVKFVNQIVKDHKTLEMCSYSSSNFSSNGEAVQKLIYDIFEYGKLSTRNWDWEIESKINYLFSDKLKNCFILNKAFDDFEGEWDNFYEKKKITKTKEIEKLSSSKPKYYKLKPIPAYTEDTLDYSFL